MHRGRTCACRAGCVLVLLAATARAEVDEGEARTRPWSGYWWPLHQGRMEEPLGKYEQYVKKKGAVAWERAHHPKARAARWEGYCHGWSAASVLEKEATQSLAAGDIPLLVGDQKGLLTACHARDVVNTFGRRWSGPGYDEKDLAPDVLWRALRLYVKQRGIPVILDVDCTSQVWNYPVYAYKVEYREAGGGVCRAQMTLWMADDAVVPGYVGIQVAKRTYQFSCQMRHGSVVMGTAKWEGASVQNHPDFGWYPYVVRPENPHLDYGVVRRMLKLSPPRPSSGPDVDLPAAPADPNQPHRPAGASESPPPPLPGQPAGGNTPVVLSPTEMLTLFTLRNKKASAFDFILQPDRGLKAIYRPGDRFFVQGSTGRAGYLYLFHVKPNAEPLLLFPLGKEDDNRVPAANKLFAIGKRDGNAVFACGNEPGYHFVRAFVTTRPLTLPAIDPPELRADRRGPDRNGPRGLPAARGNQPARANRGGPSHEVRAVPFHLDSATRAQMKEVVQAVRAEPKLAGRFEKEAGTEAAKVLPSFAYTEATFVVTPDPPKP